MALPSLTGVLRDNAYDLEVLAGVTAFDFQDAYFIDTYLTLPVRYRSLRFTNVLAYQGAGHGIDARTPEGVQVRTHTAASHSIDALGASGTAVQARTAGGKDEEGIP